MAAGSYIRFAVGLVLSVTVLASYISKDGTTVLSALLALVFIILAVLWAALRF